MKRYLGFLFIGLVTFMASGCSKPAGTIFTGLPDSNDSYYRPFKKDIRKLKDDLKSSQVNYGDIWIRDVAPVVTDHLVKFRYSPEYLSNDQSKAIDSSFRDWLDNEGFDYTESDIILDGGNFIFNGLDTVIITKRVLDDNPDYSKGSLVKELKRVLNVDNIILIDEEPGDVLGHADGQVHFIQPDTLFVGDFEGKDTVKKQILSIVPELKIVDLPSNYQEKGQYDENIPSARGLYINMMETKNDFYIPKYGLKSDKKILEMISEYTDKKIHYIDVKNLSTLGGSVNCLTWYCPDNLLPKND